MAQETIRFVVAGRGAIAPEPILENTPREMSQALPDRFRLPQEPHTMVLDPRQAETVLGFKA